MMRDSILLFSVLILLNACQPATEPVQLKGEFKKWHKITFLVEGPETSEYARVNPFLDYRLDVTFSNGRQSFKVPGFYAADGNAFETSASEGNKWMVHFRPERVGEWQYTVSFKAAKNIAVKEHTEEPEPVFGDGLSGSFSVAETDKKAPDLRAAGRIFYEDSHYFRQADGSVFLKSGAGSPENFLAFAGFDQTYRYGAKEVFVDGVRSEETNPGNIHCYEPHMDDWKEGDPVWQGNKGKGIIGAVNYLASKGMNTQYMLTMNIMGDAKDVWPWTDHNERYRFDCSKLAQWEIVFDHMEKLGMLLHLLLQETENEVLLDGGHTATQRKLYLRELIARFGHHLGVVWNLGEENGPVGFAPVGQTDDMRKEMAAFLKATNPYRSIVMLHTHGANEGQDKYLLPLLGFEALDGASMQIAYPEQIHARVKKFVSESANSGRKWIVSLDELGHWSRGIMPDSHDASHDTVRHQALWGPMMAGGAGVEWYFGAKYPHSDLNCEDFRSRDRWWDQTRICLDFFRNYLPVEKMNSADELVSAKDAWCFAKEGSIYAIYLPVGLKTTTLNLKSFSQEYSVSWYNPRSGGELQKGSVQKIQKGGIVDIGFPPNEPEEDWVVLIR